MQIGATFVPRTLPVRAGVGNPPPKGGPKGENKMHETHPAAGRPPRRGEALPPLKSTRLLDQLRERIRALHYSLRTEEAYVYWCRAFIRFHRLRHPAEMGGCQHLPDTVPAPALSTGRTGRKPAPVLGFSVWRKRA